MRLLNRIMGSDESKELRQKNEDMADALDHIVRVCNGSRAQSRRIRWIAERARCGLDGSTTWQTIDLPVNADSTAKRERRLKAQVKELQQKLAQFEREGIRE